MKLSTGDQENQNHNHKKWWKLVVLYWHLHWLQPTKSLQHQCGESFQCTKLDEKIKLKTLLYIKGWEKITRKDFKGIYTNKVKTKAMKNPCRGKPDSDCSVTDKIPHRRYDKDVK